MWVVLTVVSAFFSALTAIFAKLSTAAVSSTVLTAIRNTVMFLMTWGIVFAGGKQTELGTINGKSWIFLILTGIATGLSSLTYYKAIQIGDVSKVSPVEKVNMVFTVLLAMIVLKETMSLKDVAGCIFMIIGVIIMAL